MKLPDSPLLRTAIDGLSENQIPVLQAVVQKKPDVLAQLDQELQAAGAPGIIEYKNALRELMGTAARTNQ